VKGLRDVLADEDFGFRLVLKRGTLAEFFEADLGTDSVLAERCRWLETSPSDYAVQSEQGSASWREFAEMMGEWGRAVERPTAVEIGRVVESDLVFLMRDEAGVFRVTDGVVVFPTSWAFPEKIGLTLPETHGVVPGLNEAIGAAIDRFLNGLKPGAVATRSNWGLTSSDELNLHPKQLRPRLTEEVDIDVTWVRVEHQLLTALPKTGAILFGIRIALLPLTEVLRDTFTRSRLLRALETMPEEVAVYKGLRAARPKLVELLS